jgi:HK97 family phage major capsid protein
MDKELRKTGGFASAGEFFVAVRKYSDGDHKDSRIDVLRKTALAEGADSTGGFLVPTEWAKPIYSAAMEGSIVRSRAQIVKMTRDTFKINTLIDSDRSSSIFGGITLAWVGEGADLFASTVQPALGQLTLTAKKASMSCFIATELEDDADGLSGFLTRSFGEAMRFYEDNAYIWGTGSGQPLGIMPSGALVTVARTSYALVPALADTASMASRLLPGCWSNAVWLMNQKMLYTWAGNITDSGANATFPVDFSTMTIMGRPIIVTEKALVPGGLGDFILADFSHYVIGDRDMYISASRETTYSSSTYGWHQGQTAWRLTLRVDGQPTVPAAITPLNGGETVSPFVALTLSS